MSNIYEYFVAPSDEQAAETINWDGGPGAGAKRKGLFAKRGHWYRTIPGLGIEPTVQLGMLEELLTGVTFDAQLDDPFSRPILADRDGGERLVLGISRSFTDAVADADESALLALARPWSQIEEFWGMASVEGLSVFMLALRSLAVEAKQDGSQVYCWFSL